VTKTENVMSKNRRRKKDGKQTGIRKRVALEVQSLAKSASALNTSEISGQPQLPKPLVPTLGHFWLAASTPASILNRQAASQLSLVRFQDVQFCLFTLTTFFLHYLDSNTHHCVHSSQTALMMFALDHASFAS
jgi:hypothetical protein